MKGRVLGLLAGVALVVGAVASTATAAPSSTAPGAPGSESYFDLARKDCVGTARNTGSKVWFTVADGVLSDTYWPTVDATNVHTLQYLVTDGHSFTDLQTRDMTYKVIPDPTGMSCTVVATPTDGAHGYSVVTTYIADPSRDAVLMRTRFAAPRGEKLFVRLDPLAGGTGGGGSQNAGPNSAVIDHGVPVTFNTNTTTNASNRDYAVPTFMALESSNGFSSTSVGYADSASDGQALLDASHSLTQYTSAPAGHVTLTAGVAVPHDRTVDFALGFGTTQDQAVSSAAHTVGLRFDNAWFRYEHQWLRYDRGLRRPSLRLGRAAVREYYESVNVVKASEDKTFPGAIAAGLASPWGQAIPAGNFTNGQPTYFGSYREVFARDLYEAFAGLLVAGDVRTAQDTTRFLFERQQQPDGSMPRNSLENGKVAPDTGGLQLDETSYPILMAWQSGLAYDSSLYANHVIPAADFLVAHGPSNGVERWEEQSGFSPSTIAAEIAGLTAASHIARVNGDSVRADIYQATADYFARSIKAWTVTTTGKYGTGRYFLRLSRTGDPNAASSYNLGNGSISDDQRRIVDQGFLELVRLGVLPANDPDVQASLKVIDSTIEVTTPSGPGFYRYGTDLPGSEDGYGDCHVADATNCTIEGKPWPTFDPGANAGNVGSGHLWPVLGGERGEYDVAAGDRGRASTFLTAMRNMTSGQGLEPEQAWEDDNVPASPFGSDPTTASIGFVNGKPAGSASPLTWAQSQYARLALAIGAGRDLETPGIVTHRYVTRGMPGSLPITITSPDNNTRVTSATVTVTGTSAAGARIDAEGLGAAGGVAGTASAVADGAGNWSLVVPTGFGSTAITVTATRGRSTGYSQLTVINAALPGNSVLDSPDPTGDDNGPGTYQYPTDSSFTRGSFDLNGLRVNEDGTNVYIQVSIAKLVPTFGNNFGAQLLDVYVRNPGAANTSTAAAYPQLNYAIASNSAWSERLEAQGFASPIWVGASGASLGTTVLVVDEPSQTATLIVPQSVFGTVGNGWVFTVALTGQNGFNSYQARDFTQPAGGFTFGVCPAGDTTDAICAFDPNKVPKVVDTVTPPGVSQATELDPTHGSVALQGVPAP
jgi:glucoamylase